MFLIVKGHFLSVSKPSEQTTASDSLQRQRRLRSALAFVCLVCGALTLLAATGLLCLERRVGWNMALFMVAGNVLLVSGLCGRLLSLKLLLAIFIVSGSLVPLMAGATLFGIDISRIGQIKEQVVPPRPIGIWTFSDRFGYAHQPGVTGVHEDRRGEFLVTYTIDGDGCRLMTPPEAPRGSVLILGGSWTFGHGVADDECYPARLAMGPWSKLRVTNRAVMGWGLPQASLALTQAFASADRRPDLVVYAMIPDHIPRSYICADWFDRILRWPLLSPEQKRGWPHFEPDVTGPRFEKIAMLADGVPRTPEVTRKELTLTRQFLEQMAEECRGQGVPFVVVLFPAGQGTAEWPVAVLETVFRDERITPVNLTDMRIDHFPHDPHPNPADHLRISEQLADHPEVKRLIEGVGSPP